MSLKPCGSFLSRLPGKGVAVVDDCIGHRVEAAVEKLAEGDLLLLENLRYSSEETGNEAGVAAKLAELDLCQ
jgi:phosphoglycerate kinase